ncbi:2-keto-3-deoxy-D-arabino-heptulosonate-7-phosphate synthase I alpha [Vibrio sp. JCM 19236]|nr:2-keto-3-deoxy-D-arabino-heptulosonate-7-phosphate synthase I alpha [Vibrio sp. JCM 19236]
MDDLTALEYGKSITDPCLSWEHTVEMLDILSDSVKTQQ